MTQPRPRVILLDVGGVCVQSPFLAIANYETDNAIPTGYINFALSRRAPHGFYHRLERGEIDLDDSFFRGFQQDLTDPVMWAAFCERARTGPGRREGPRHGERQGHGEGRGRRGEDIEGQQKLDPKTVPHIDGRELFWRMYRISANPDPFIFPAIQYLRSLPLHLSSSSSPPPPSSSSSPLPPSQRRYIVGALSNAVVFPDGVVDEHGLGWRHRLIMPGDDAETDNHNNTGGDRRSGQHRYAPERPLPGDEAATKAAMDRLRPYSHIESLPAAFDFYLNSAEIGLRKPDPAVFWYAIEQVNTVVLGLGKGNSSVDGGGGNGSGSNDGGGDNSGDDDSGGGGQPVTPEEVIFLDDIGENLKTAKKIGMRTIKVELGKSRLAVEKLEEWTGESLLDGYSPPPTTTTTTTTTRQKGTGVKL